MCVCVCVCVQKEIRSLLERDSFRRFLGSKMHRELMVAVEADKNGSFIIDRSH